jgi:hypothetical protein
LSPASTSRGPEPFPVRARRKRTLNRSAPLGRTAERGVRGVYLFLSPPPQGQRVSGAVQCSAHAGRRLGGWGEAPRKSA